MGWLWGNSDAEAREQAQNRMLSANTRQNAQIKKAGRNGAQLYTVDMKGPAGTDHLSPVVMIHGFGMGLAFWARQLDDFAKHRRVIAFDLPGMGCSDRPAYSGSTLKEAEDYFIGAIYNWQKAMGIQRMVLVGHAFGAYLAAVYAIKHPTSVTQLVFSSPVGLEKYNRYLDHGDAHMLLSAFWNMHVTPQGIVRSLGKWLGMKVVQAFAARRFVGESVTAIRQISEYVYHLWIVRSDAEMAYRTLIGIRGYGKKPLCARLHKLRAPATFIFGEHDWRPHTPADDILPKLPVVAKVVLIRDASHHSYMDNYQHFNALVCRALTDGMDGKAAGKREPSFYVPSPENSARGDNEDESVRALRDGWENGWELEAPAGGRGRRRGTTPEGVDFIVF